MEKVYKDAASAMAGLVKDGMTIMAGGFGLCGIPETLIDAIRDSGAKDLTFISNNAGVDGVGLGVLLETRQIRKMISSYVGENKLFAQQYLSGELELEFNPQGTLAERIRAGGAGIPAFFTKTGVGTLIAEGKEVREFDGETYVMERGLFADIAVVHAWKGDTEGNLVYRKTARNFNPMMATAAQGDGRRGRASGASRARSTRISIHTPGIFVKRIVHVPNPVEAHRAAHDPQARRSRRRRRRGGSLMAWTREQMAARAAKELRDGFYVNLGIGIPTLVSNYIPEGMRVQLQSRERHARHGAVPVRGRGGCRPDQCRQADRSPNCRRRAISPRADSFGMIRGGHIDLSILGAMQVAENGDLANWMIPGKMVKGMGGAMDLVAGVKRVVVVMEHVPRPRTARGSEAAEGCNLPLTGAGVVDLVITDLGVFAIDKKGGAGMTLIELADGVTRGRDQGEDGGGVQGRSQRQAIERRLRPRRICGARHPEPAFFKWRRRAPPLPGSMAALRNRAISASSLPMFSNRRSLVSRRK